jgi:protein SCO1
MKLHSKLLSFALLCSVGIAGIAAVLLWRHPAPAVELTTGSFVAPSRALPDFSLIDHQGRRFGAPNLRGHWSLLFFGYINCPSICPATLTTLAAMQARLRAEHAAVLPQVIFLSLDAERDTPAQLARFLPNFDPSFIGVTAADQPSVEAVARKLGVAVGIQPAAGGNYAVEHTGAILVLNPQARLTAILTGPFSTGALRADFQRIVAAPGVLTGRT